MRIAIDLSAVRTTGTLVYSRGFLPAFVKLLGSSDELTVFGPESLREVVSPLAGPEFRFLRRPSLENVPYRIWWQQTSLPRQLRAIKADVLFAPYDIGPWNGVCPMVVGIRNPNPVIFQGGVIPISWEHRMFGTIHRSMVAVTCRHAQLLIFPSEYAARAVGGLLPGKAGQKRVVYHGLDTEFWTEARSAAAVRERAVLFASKFYPQKRAALLVEAFALLQKRVEFRDYRLDYCGEDAGSDAAQAVLARARQLGISQWVTMRGIVTRAELRSLYGSASAVVMPTVMETFGFPYVEAMASEAPLVCADIEVARELCGEAPWYFRADDAESLAEALASSMAESPEQAAKLAEGVKRAAQFSWSREAEETLACLREAASGQSV